jgi:L-rhamnose-H+ transport protein
VILFGVAVCIAGIGVAGAAGLSKEREMPAEKKREAIREFNLKRGVLVATFSGIMSSCFAYGLAAGDPIKELTLRHGTATLWQGLPVLVVILAGGFTTNFLWCSCLNLRNGTGRQYFHAEVPLPETELPAGFSESGGGTAVMARPAVARAPMVANYLFCALAGTTWYMQFFFYTMGETQMGRYKFSSWTLHMASIMIFSTLWGIALKEWSGVSRRTQSLVALTLLVLVGSTVIVGYGNYLATGK